MMVKWTDTHFIMLASLCILVSPTTPSKLQTCCMQRRLQIREKYKTNQGTKTDRELGLDLSLDGNKGGRIKNYYDGITPHRPLKVQWSHVVQI